MHQQQWDGDGGDVMGAADLQDVPQAHDGWVPCCDVSRTHIIIHTEVKHNMNLRQVWMACDVEFTWREREHSSVTTNPTER